MLKNIIAAVFIIPLVIISVYVGYRTHSSKEYKFSYAGLERRYRLHYPKNYNEEQKYPLVMAIHGYFDDARLLELYSGLSAKADKEGFIVLYPYGYRKNIITPLSWNASFCCAWSYENNVDDLGFLTKLLEHIVSSGSVDTEKIYLVGVSNGAMMSNLLATQLAGKISAVASIAGAVGAKYEEDEEFSYLQKSYQPVSALIIHGHKDKVIPFDGGMGKHRLVQFTGAYDTLNFWLENNKCERHPSEISNQSLVSSEFYKNCESSVVEFYATESPHTWPGNVNDVLNVFSGKSVVATDLIWDFFSRSN